jgi:hypothetical protein
MLVALAACQSPPAPSPAPVPETETSAPVALMQTLAWQLDTAGPRLRKASCPDGAPFVPGTEAALSATPVTLNLPEGSKALADGVSFVAGWHLTSPDARFGGLSGMEFTRAGNLVAVSDDGAWAWIGIDPETPDHKPDSLRLGTMYGEDGNPLDDKTARDAESIAMGDDGLALVGFERDHRILAFDLEGCGAGARGIAVTSWDSRPAGLSKAIGDNAGAEGLALSGWGGLMVTLEENEGGTPFATLPDQGEPYFDRRLPTPGLLSTTGLDAEGDLYSVHRFYAPGIGNRIAVQSTRFGRTLEENTNRTLLTLERPATVDNFEAITAKHQEDGSTLLAIMSDDNFSRDQRTLLLFFRVAAEP